ncbi:MAG: hypothetical protein ACI8RZ_001745 [Myxococcota bacterium]|jgi:hypothetical protein
MNNRQPQTLRRETAARGFGLGLEASVFVSPTAKLNLTAPQTGYQWLISPRAP